MDIIKDEYNSLTGPNGRWLNQEEIEKAKSYFAENPEIVKWSRKESGLSCSVIKGDDGKLYAIARSNKVYNRIKGSLGKGAYGKVKLMQCLDDKTILAAKIQANQTYNQEAEDNIAHEAKMLEATQELLGQATRKTLFKHKHYIFSNFVQGKSLTDYLKDNPQLNYNEKLGILLKVLKATKNLHDKRIIHGDLSFNNVLYDSQTGTVKIIDFGFAQEVDQSLKKEDLVTWRVTLDTGNAYLPPEMVPQHRNLQGQIGYKSDVYMLGKWIELFNNPPDEKIQSLTKEMTQSDIEKRCSLDDCIKHINKILAEQTEQILPKDSDKSAKFDSRRP